MANPVQNQENVQRVAQQEPAEIPRAPAGVGDTPTTVESAGRQQPYEPGYIEKGVYWIKDMILWAFKKIFSCWFPEAPPPALPEPPPAIQPPRLWESVTAEVRLMDAFGRLTDNQKKRIHHLIGKEKFQYYHVRDLIRSYEEIGKNEVERNPMILNRYMDLHPNQEQIVI